MTTNGKLKGLSQAEVLDLLGKSRTRNTYGPKLVAFCDSDEAAIDVAATWPTEFATKSGSALYQSFASNIKKADLQDTIEVRKVDEHVYLLHKERVELVKAAL